MDLRQFRYFVAVAEELHFTRAAQRLNIAQPPLSLQIKMIEEELGTLLLKRTRRKVELTPAGELFLHEARMTLLQAERAVETVVRAARGEIGTLRLSFVTSAPLTEVFTNSIRAFRVAWPNVHLELMARSSAVIIEDLLLKKVDIGFTRPSLLSMHPKSIEAIPIHEDRLMAVFPVDHPMGKTSTPISINDLRDEQFVLRPKGSGTGFYEQIFTICGEAGFTPQITQEAIEATTTLGLVAAGVGITIAPRALRRIQVPHVVWRKILDAETHSRLYLVYNSSAGPDKLRDKFVSTFKSIDE